VINVGLVTIKINGQTASLRTRRRVREGGPSFLLVNENADTKEVLVKGLGSGWSGWLPINEIKITAKTR